LLAVLTFGAYSALAWTSRCLLPGPFALVSQLPFFSGNRYPSRYSVMLLIGVGVLAAYGLASALMRLAQSRRPTQSASAGESAPQWMAWLLAAVCGLFLFEHLSTPLPLNDFRIPPIYDRLAAVEGDFAVLELPTGWRNGARVQGISDELIMMQQWYQTRYGQHRLGGNTSRNPAYKFDYFIQAPLIGDLIGLMNADREHVAPVVEAELGALIAANRPRAADVLDQLGVEFVVVHVEESPPALLRFIDAVLPLALVEEWKGDNWRGEASTIRLYQVASSQQPSTKQPSTKQIDIPSEAGRLHLAEGWSSLASSDGHIRYATANPAELMLDLPERGGLLQIELFGPAREAEILLNGETLGSFVIDDSPQVVELAVPPGVANQLVDRLRFDFGDAVTPAHLTATSPDERGWSIGATGAFLAPDAALVVASAGEEVGNDARLFVNGREIADEGRGYHLVALDATGAVLDRTQFDTLAAPSESAAMAAWLDALPNGVIVAGAVADEASYNLSQDAVDALARLGVATDLRGHFRWSHAFVGVVGAAPGSALEASSLLRPAVVAVGAPVDAEFVSGGVGRIDFTPAQSAPDS
ncbi:MAG: hypothetical protein HC802_19960, partial [Caldilineaceae bacterium]|nr:hypothetical protein [Caldilineaceae bacterium]